MLLLHLYLLCVYKSFISFYFELIAVYFLVRFRLGLGYVTTDTCISKIFQKILLLHLYLLCVYKSSISFYFELIAIYFLVRFRLCNKAYVHL